MLNIGKFSHFFGNRPWTEAANTATPLENNLLMPSRNLSPFQCIVGREKELSLLWCHHLVLCISWTTTNLDTPIIWGDFADGHSVSIYHMLNLKTQKIV